MYTVYVNDCPLRLAAEGEEITNPPAIALRYGNRVKFLLQVIGTLEGGKHPEGALIWCRDVEAAWSDFQSLFKIVPAAGGAVLNRERLLCIYRRGSWDLPKGKIDEGEDEPTAALREVTEETGISELRLGDALPTTYHTYRLPKGKRVLKPTYWYRMRTEQEALVPQASEDIERAVWVGEPQLTEIRSQMYPSLWSVLDAASGRRSVRLDVTRE